MWNTLHALSDPLAWLSIGVFVAAIVLDWRGFRSIATQVGGLAWGLFGIFWLSMFPYFWFDFGSPLEGALSLVAVPLCVYTGYLLASGRESLLLLSKAVAVMGIIYLPAMLIEPINRFLIETVTVQTHFGMELLGHSPGIEQGLNGYQSRFGFEGPTTYIILACTGIGSIAIFGGLIAATSASIKRKLIGIALATGIIWVLNLIRNVFVGLATPLGWFEYAPLETLTLWVVGPGTRTSFFVSHHLISQTLAVFALIGIALLVMRVVPEILEILEEALFVATGSEWDLTGTTDRGPVRADGGT